MKTNILFALFGTLLATSVVLGQSSFDTSPDTQTGERVLGSYFATDIATISLTNGNLHLDIPLFNLPGRELPARLSMDYNSKFFQQRTIAGAGGTPTTTADFLGWRKNTGLGGMLTTTTPTTFCPPGVTSYTIDLYWVEWNGTKHHFSKTVPPR